MLLVNRILWVLICCPVYGCCLAALQRFLLLQDVYGGALHNWRATEPALVAQHHVLCTSFMYSVQHLTCSFFPACNNAWNLPDLEDVVHRLSTNIKYDHGCADWTSVHSV